MAQLPIRSRQRPAVPVPRTRNSSRRMLDPKSRMRLQRTTSQGTMLDTLQQGSSMTDGHATRRSPKSDSRSHTKVLVNVQICVAVRAASPRRIIRQVKRSAEPKRCDAAWRQP